jgi:hypothetical protein
MNNTQTTDQQTRQAIDDAAHRVRNAEMASQTSLALLESLTSRDGPDVSNEIQEISTRAAQELRKARTAYTLALLARMSYEAGDK